MSIITTHSLLVCTGVMGAVILSEIHIRSSKIEIINLEVFNMIKRVNESRKPAKHISCDCRCEFNTIKPYKNGTIINVNVSVKKSIRYWACEEDHVWNPSACTFECDKNCKIGEYLKSSECMKSAVDNLLVTCDKIVDTTETAPINTNDEKNY